MSQYFDSTVQRLLEARLGTSVTVPGFGSPSVVFDNVAFAPTPGAPFITSNYNPASRRPITAGLPHTVRYDVFLNLVIFTPAGEGTQEARRIADAIIDLFPVGHQETADNVTVTVRYCERQAGFQEGDWFQTPMTVAAIAFESE